MRSNKSSFKYGAGAAVCAMLLLGHACAREEMSVASPTERVARAQDDALDGGAESADAQVRSDDAGAPTGKADAGVNSRAAESPRAGSGGSDSSPRASGSQGGAGGMPVRALGGRAGAGGADEGVPVDSEPEAAGGAGGARGEAGSEPRAEAGSGGTGGTRAAPEGAAGKPAEREEPSDRDGPDDEDEPDQEPERSADAGTSSGSDEPSACEQIATACAAVTDPSDEVRSCLSVGQAADASACAGRIEACRQNCGAPLCEQVLVVCPATGSGPVQGCHQIGVTDNAGDCFGDGVKCIEYCNEVATP